MRILVKWSDVMSAETCPECGEPLLTIPQVAQRLGVSERKTWRLIAEGELRLVRLRLREARVAEGIADEYIERIASARR
jgi:excisionase family DNA binding protein